MGIGRRFIDMARSELNSLLDKAAELGSEEEPVAATADDDDGNVAARARAKLDLSSLSDAELEAEIQRRTRERAQAAARARVERETAEWKREREEKEARNQSRTRASSPAPRPDGADAVRRAYAALELKPGADFEAVKKQYRTLMRKYHPDRHAGSPEKQKAAHELATKLTESYKLLEKKLKK